MWKSAASALLGASLVMLVGGSHAHAQGMLFDVFPDDGEAVHYPVGVWSEYLIRLDKGTKVMRMRAALVARTDEGREIFEQSLYVPETAEQPFATVRVTVANPIGYPRRVMELASSILGGSPIDMTWVDREDQESVPQRLPSLGSAEVKVPAGRFTVEHHKLTDSSGVFEDWVNFEVGPLGLVRWSGTGRGRRQSITVELVARGTGAKPTVLGVAQRHSDHDLRMISMWRGLAECSRRRAAPAQGRRR